MEEHKIDKSQWIANMLGALAMQDDGGDQAWDLYRREYENGYWATGTNIGAIAKDNVSKARNDGKIRRFPWNARNWHLDMAIGICNAHDIPYYGEHESQIYARKSRNSAEKARDYHINSPRFRRGDILEEMRSELNIKPVDYFNFTGYTTIKESYKVNSDGYTAVW